MEESSFPSRRDIQSLRISPDERAGGSAGSGRRWLLPTVLLLIATAAAAAWMLIPRGDAVFTVATTTARSLSAAQVDAVLTASGFVASRQQADIGAKVPGIVEQVLFDEGDAVTAGQLLVVLEHAELEAARDLVVASRERARADVDSLRAQLTEAEREVARQQRLLASAVGTREAIEKAEATRDSLAAQLGAAEARVRVEQAALRQAEQALADTRIRAPFAGTVIAKSVELGEAVSGVSFSGTGTAGAVATLADLSRLEVEADVKETYLGRVRLGQSAELRIDAIPDRTYRGRVARIVPRGDRARGVVRVEVDVLDPDDRLYPDTSATVTFSGDDDPSAAVDAIRTVVPAAAVRRGAGGDVVFRVDGDRAAAVAVELGPLKEGLHEVLRGLNGGEVLILDPPEELTSGDRVERSP